MPTIRPFRAYLPSKELVEKTVSLPYGFYDKESLFQTLVENQFSFLHIIKPDFLAAEKLSPGSEQLFRQCKLKFVEFVEKGIYKKNESPCLYIYRINSSNHEFTGIIAAVSVEDPGKGKILFHENTLENREDVLRKYLEHCDINAEPTSMIYPASSPISEIIAVECESNPYFDFSDKKYRHRLWLIDDEDIIEKLKTAFDHLPSAYVADGHHRIASSMLHAADIRKKKQDKEADDPAYYFQGIFFPANEVVITSFHRLVQDLNNMTVDDFFYQLSSHFIITKSSNPILKPDRERTFGMYLNEAWFLLELKKAHHPPSEMPDTNVLGSSILTPILGITDFRKDKRIAYVSSENNLSSIKQQMKAGNFEICFTMHPPDARGLMCSTDAQYRMPPKSTYIEPKILNGLVIYSMGED